MKPHKSAEISDTNPVFHLKRILKNRFRLFGVVVLFCVGLAVIDLIFFPYYYENRGNIQISPTFVNYYKTSSTIQIGRVQNIKTGEEQLIEPPQGILTLLSRLTKKTDLPRLNSATLEEGTDDVIVLTVFAKTQEEGEAYLTEIENPIINKHKILYDTIQGLNTHVLKENKEKINIISTINSDKLTAKNLDDYYTARNANYFTQFNLIVTPQYTTKATTSHKTEFVKTSISSTNFRHIFTSIILALLGGLSLGGMLVIFVETVHNSNTTSTPPRD